MRNRVLVFFGVACGFTWAYWFWMLANGVIVGESPRASHLPGLLGPLIGALSSTALFDGREGLHGFWARLFKLPIPVPTAVAVLSAPVFVLLVIAVAFGVTYDARSYFLYPGIDHSLNVVVIFGIAFIINGYGEEAGWRGYLQHHLTGRFSKQSATMAVAGLWLIWHLPIFFIHTGMRDLIGPALLGWVLGLTLASFVLGWMYFYFGRSILMVALWHTIYNYTVATPPTTGAIAAVVTSIVMLGGLVVAVFWIMQRQKVGSSPSTSDGPEEGHDAR